MMKKNVLSLTLTALLAVSIFSCSDKGDEELSAEVGLMGKWTLQSADLSINGQSMDAYIRSMAEQMGMSEEEASEMFNVNDEFETGTTIDFQDNSVIVITENDGAIERGTWTSTAKTVTITIDDDPMTLDVKSLKKSSAVFAMSMEGDDDSEMAENLAIEIIMSLSK
ncbi:hypothetical protein [Catalinimonas niigatensis]|uniref:hypothetical protein n=1 Tax=Catalinimonas niigatensis TaxID=1397264 RepID=UPI0026655AB6|nr:hypothetical protein [Catalinimonas niigatensis]WPP48558.1 hypothetical protein PZB72_17960 [Catalinimonas niigatensis]